MKLTFYGTYAITEPDIISFENTAKVWLHRRLKWFTLFEFQWTLSCFRSPLNVVDDTEQMTVDQKLKQIIKISPLFSHIFIQCQGCHTPITAKFPVISPCFQLFHCNFFWPQNITFNLLPLPIDRYTTTTNIHSKPQSQIQQSLLQNYIPLLGCPPKQNLLQSQKIGTYINFSNFKIVTQ